MPITRKRKPEQEIQEALREGFDGRTLPPGLFSALDKIKEAQLLPELEEDNKAIQPQPGPQMMFAKSPADIAIIGGAAFGGKSYSLLLEGGRHVDNPDWRVVGFRRTSPELSQPGGLADVSYKIYPNLRGKDLDNGLTWRFPSGARIEFRHLQYETDVHAWQSSQVPLFLFDELTHFTEFQTFYIMTRNRSISGIEPYFRGALNPDPTSWVTKILSPWIDRQYEGPQGKAKIGELRWFTRDEEGNITWVKPSWRDIFGNPAKSITFIQAFAWDNLLGMKYNPKYLSNLLVQDYVTQQRLLWGNWEVVETGNMFRRAWFKDRIVDLDKLPEKLTLVLWWDLAGVDPNKVRNKNQPDFTCGVLMGKNPVDGSYWILDMIMAQDSPGAIKELVFNKTQKLRERWSNKYGRIHVRMGRDPGSAGISVIDDYAEEFKKLGFNFEGILESGSKVDRARPLSADAYHKNVWMFEAPWNDTWFKYACIFPKKGEKDDPIDASSGAHYCLEHMVDEMGSTVPFGMRYGSIHIPSTSIIEQINDHRLGYGNSIRRN